MMKFKIGDYIKEFRIYAISYPAGIFKDESQKYLRYCLLIQLARYLIPMVSIILCL